MSKLQESFKNKKALITYITAGDPTLVQTEKLVYALEKAGADIIELGIPFSDPLADGPIIQASHQRALKKKVSLKNVFALVKKLRKKTQVPIVFMLSDNLVEKYGKKKFYADCETFEVDGVIVPDLPPEEAKVDLSTEAQRAKVDNIFLIAPTSTEERIKIICDASSGFVYLVSLTGITGKQAKLSSEVEGLVSRVRKYTKLPLAIGFGISNPAQAKEAARYADGVIVGSAIVDLIGKKQYAKVSKFVSSLRRALDA